MPDRRIVEALKTRIHEDLITEAVRRAMELPQFAGAEPELVRAMVTAEVNKGNVTLFGVLRSVRRMP